MTKLLRFGLVALAAIAVIGCSQKGGGTEGTEVVKAPGKKVKVVYIPKNTGNAYFDEVINGFKAVADKVNVEFTTVGPAKADATSQISYIKDQVQKGVDVIAITPNSPDALNSALDEAKAKGVLVITVDADLVGNETHRAACVLPTDFKDVGTNQLDTLASQLPGGGDFAILSATRDAPNQNAWIDGIKKALTDPKYSKLKLVDVVYGDDQADKSTTEAQGLLAKYPNLRGIISPTSAGLPATAQVLETAGVYPGGPHAAGGGVVLTGLGAPKAMVAYVNKGVVAKFQLWNPRSMGVLACFLAAHLKAGDQKTDPGTKVSGPGVGEVAFGQNGVIYAGPMITFDKGNIGLFHF